MILAALVLVAAGGLLEALACSRQCPIEVRVANIEPSGMVNDAGAEMLLVSLTITNRDCVDVMFDAAKGFEARSAVGNWMPVTYEFTVARIAPGRQVSLLLLAPPATSACRLRLHYQTQIWKCRLMHRLGVRGRTLVARSRLLCKLVWPDELKTMPVPPHWRQTTIEAIITGEKVSAAKPLGHIPPCKIQLGAGGLRTAATLA